MNDTGIRSYPASRAFDWLAEGWRLFKLSPKVWLLATVMSVVISLLLAAIPKVGQLLANFAALFLFGGLLLIAQDVDAGRTPPLSRLFAVFQTQLVPVLLTTVLMSLVVGILVFVVVLVAGGTAVMGGLTAGSAAKLFSLSAGGVVMLLGALAIMAVSSALWFSPGLVVLRNMGAWDSIKQSALGFLRNWTAMLLMTVIFFGLAIAATIPFGLGWLVLTPVLCAASYASIKDVFAGADAAV